MGTIVDNLLRERKEVWNLDYSKFDQSVIIMLINVAFDVLEECFDSSTFWKGKKLGPIGKKYWTELTQEGREWHAVKEYFINTPIADWSGNVFRKKGGVPSGSFFTQLVDCVVNYLGTVYAFAMKGQEVKPYTLGDDALFTVPVGKVTPEEIAKELEVLHLNLNADKTSVATTKEKVTFLGHTYKGNYFYREFSELFIHMLYPENRVETPMMSYARASALLLDSADNNVEWMLITKEYERWLKLTPEMIVKASDQKVSKFLQHVAMVSSDQLGTSFYELHLWKINWRRLEIWY